MNGGVKHQRSDNRQDRRNDDNPVLGKEGCKQHDERQSLLSTSQRTNYNIRLVHVLVVRDEHLTVLGKIIQIQQIVIELKEGGTANFLNNNGETISV